MATYNINVRTESHIAASTAVEMDDVKALRIEMARYTRIGRSM